MRGMLSKTLLLACVVTCVTGVRAQQSRPAAAGPDSVVRRFYGWYLRRIVGQDLYPLENRREALKYVTPGFRVRAPRISGREGADILICAQDWQAEWGESMRFTPARVRGAKATTRMTWGVGGQQYHVDLTLVKVGGAWRIDGAKCDADVIDGVPLRLLRGGRR